MQCISQSSLFDAAWYLNQYHPQGVDVSTAAEHYHAKGWKQGLDPSPLFSTLGYLEMYPDVKAVSMNPLLHYIKFGCAEGRCYMKSYATYVEALRRQQYKVESSLHRCLSTFLNCGRIMRNKAVRILVCVHAVDKITWPLLKSYLRYLTPYHYDLRITCSEVLRTEIEQDKFLRDCFPYILTIAEEENDFASLLKLLQGVSLDDYDIVLKLCSTDIERIARFEYGRVTKGVDMPILAYDSLVGRDSVHETIHQLYRYSHIGIVAPEPLIVQDREHIRRMVCAYAQKRGVKILNYYHFVDGGSFGIKASLLKDVISDLASTEANVQIRRTLEPLPSAVVHARLLCAMIEPKGYVIRGNTAKLDDYAVECIRFKQRSPERLLYDERIHVDDAFFFSVLSHYDLMDYKLEVVPVKTLKQRINDELHDFTNLHYTDVKQQDKDNEQPCSVLVDDTSREVLYGVDVCSRLYALHGVESEVDVVLLKIKR